MTYAKRIETNDVVSADEGSVKNPWENLLCEVLLLAAKDYFRAVKSGKDGIYCRKKYREFFKDNWIYPLIDIDGDIFSHAIEVYAEDIRSGKVKKYSRNKTRGMNYGKRKKERILPDDA